MRNDIAACVSEEPQTTGEAPSWATEVRAPARASLHSASPACDGWATDAWPDLGDVYASPYVPPVRSPEPAPSSREVQPCDSVAPAWAERQPCVQWEQPTLPMDLLAGWLPMTTIDEARASVVAEWSDTQRLRPQSIEKFDGLLGRFVAFARAFRVVALADVDAGLVDRFIRARGRNRHGQVSDAAVATMQVRRAVLRAFYRTARELQLTWDDPARDVDLPRRRVNSPRPLTPEEADLLWMHAWSGHRQTRHAATIALMLSGAHTSEVGHVTAADLAPEAGTVWAHGFAKYRPRDLAAGTAQMSALLARRDLLVGRHPEMPLDRLVLATGASGSDAHKQARVCVTASEVLRWAGLGDGPRPASISAFAALEAFAVSGQIEAAANVLGLSSLDAAARAVGWDWRTGAESRHA